MFLPGRQRLPILQEEPLSSPLGRTSSPNSQSQASLQSPGLVQEWGCGPSLTSEAQSWKFCRPRSLLLCGGCQTGRTQPKVMELRLPPAGDDLLETRVCLGESRSRGGGRRIPHIS